MSMYINPNLDEEAPRHTILLRFLGLLEDFMTMLLPSPVTAAAVLQVKKDFGEKSEKLKIGEKTSNNKKFSRVGNHESRSSKGNEYFHKKHFK